MACTVILGGACACIIFAYLKAHAVNWKKLEVLQGLQVEETVSAHSQDPKAIPYVDIPSNLLVTERIHRR